MNSQLRTFAASLGQEFAICSENFKNKARLSPDACAYSNQVHVRNLVRATVPQLLHP